MEEWLILEYFISFFKKLFYIEDNGEVLKDSNDECVMVCVYVFMYVMIRSVLEKAHGGYK